MSYRESNSHWLDWFGILAFIPRVIYLAMSRTIKHPKVKNYAGRRKGRSSHKDKAKDKESRERNF